MSSLLFDAIGLGYLLAPAAMISIVGINSTPTIDFLMRTEGVALLTGAGLLAAVRTGSNYQVRLALLSLTGYYGLGLLVDLAAFNTNVVRPAAAPSRVVRITVGIVCAVAAWRLPR